jgi:polysaccharide chain length determinant protein (PEP-CTERM system associated)
MPHGHRNTSTGAQIRALWARRKWLALSVFIVVFAAMAALVATLPSLYRATATVLVNPYQAQPSLIKRDGPESLNARVEMISQQVLSRRRLERLIEKFKLYTRLRHKGSMAAAVGRMRQDIHFVPVQAGGRYGRSSTVAFTLSYQGWKPRVAAEVTNALAAYYVRANTSVVHTEALADTAALRAQLQPVARKLNAQQARINAFKTLHNGELPEQERMDLSTVNRLNEELQTDRGTELSAIGIRQKILSDMSREGASLGQLERRLVRLRTHYTANYPDIVRLQAEISALRAERSQNPINGGLHRRLAQIDGEITDLHKQDAQLRAAVARYQRQLNRVPIVEQQLQALTRGYAETRGVYANLLRQFEEAHALSTTESGSSGLFRVIDGATAPGAPFAPARARLLFMCLVLSLAAAACTVFVREQFDTTFHTVDELRTFARVPVLAQIPRVMSPGDNWRRYVRGCMLAGVTAMALVTAIALGYQFGHGNQQLVWMIAKHEHKSTT